MELVSWLVSYLVRSNTELCPLSTGYLPSTSLIHLSQIALHSDTTIHIYVSTVLSHCRLLLVLYLANLIPQFASNFMQV
jgi:hypothetical protein